MGLLKTKRPHLVKGGERLLEQTENRHPKDTDDKTKKEHVKGETRNGEISSNSFDGDHNNF